MGFLVMGQGNIILRGYAEGKIAAQVVKRGRGHPRAYLLPSPVGKATDPEETFRPAVCPRSKVGSPTPFTKAACGICVVHLGDISTVHAMQQAHSDACSLHRQSGAYRVSMFTSTVCTD